MTAPADEIGTGCTCLLPVEALGYQHAVRCPAAGRGDTDHSGDIVLRYFDSVRRMADGDTVLLDRIDRAEAERRNEPERVAARPAEPPGELLHAAREWIFRHSSQPDGDRWTDNPDHLDWAARNLLVDLAPWLGGPR